MRSRVVAAAAASALAAGGLAAAIHFQARPDAVSPYGGASGQQLFLAVVFGQGELAKELGNRAVLADFYKAGYVDNNGPQQIAAANQVVESIAAKDPGYFAGFARAVRSGSPYVVSDAVAGVEQEFQKVGLQVDTPTVPGPAAATRPAAPRPRSININYHINLNLHTNVNVALNENVALNVNIFKTRKVAFTDPFQHDVMIGELASVLKT